MTASKTIIFLGDGMADEGIAELGGKTPLEHANTPAMDSIARDGCSGTLHTLPDGFPTSSEVANMSVLGCDLVSEYCGRGPLEAAGRNIILNPEDVACRLNLINQQDGVLKDFSAGHVAQKDAEALIAELNNAFGSDSVHFYSGVSYRNLLVLSGSQYSKDVTTEKPDDNHDQKIEDHLPSAQNAQAEMTAAFLREVISKAPLILQQSDINKTLNSQGRTQANGVWPWSPGSAGSLKTLKDKYGISGAAISAVDVIVGLGRMLGMDIITVPGATGYIDTNYEGKADAAIEALKTHDLVYLHVEAIDEVSHAQNLDLKLRAIEDFDQRVIGRVLSAFGPELNVAVLPDHPVPVALGKHTRVPVPVAVRIAGMKPDSVMSYGESACKNGSLGAMQKDDLMNILFRK